MFVPSAALSLFLPLLLATAAQAPHQQRTRMELRLQRELQLLELARQLGSRVDQLPRPLVPVAG